MTTNSDVELAGVERLLHERGFTDRTRSVRDRVEEALNVVEIRLNAEIERDALRDKLARVEAERDALAEDLTDLQTLRAADTAEAALAGAPRFLVNVDDAAARLGVSRRWMRRAVQERRITHVKVGRLVRFRPQDLDSYEQSRTVAARGDAG